MELTGRNYDFSSLDKVQLSDLVRVFCCIQFFGNEILKLAYGPFFGRSGERHYIPLTVPK